MLPFQRQTIWKPLAIMSVNRSGDNVASNSDSMCHPAGQKTSHFVTGIRGFPYKKQILLLQLVHKWRSG